MSSNRNNRVDGIGYKSSLPLTDPRHVVPHAHCAVHRCRRTVWCTGDRRPSPAKQTDVHRSWQHLRLLTWSCEIFTARRYASAVYAVVRVSVRLSVCHKPALYQNG